MFVTEENGRKHCTTWTSVYLTRKLCDNSNPEKDLNETIILPHFRLSRRTRTYLRVQIITVMQSGQFYRVLVRS